MAAAVLDLLKYSTAFNAAVDKRDSKESFICVIHADYIRGNSRLFSVRCRPGQALVPRVMIKYKI